MSRKSNVNTDHYKTAGRGPQCEGLVPEVHKRSFARARSNAAAVGETFFPGAHAESARATRLAKLKLLGRPGRRGKPKGLSAKQLMERRNRAGRAQG